MRITCQKTVQKANHRHLQSYGLLAKGLGLDGISFLAADVTSEAFNQGIDGRTNDETRSRLRPTRVPVLEQEVEELIARFADDIRDGYIAESA